MFSHVVIFWTNPGEPGAADKVIANAEKHLKSVPGILHFHVGRKESSARAVVDQTYQVGLNIVFTDKEAQDAYQAHPQHLEFVAQTIKPFVQRVVVYDFS